jgi:large subunit ribosomal protein L13
MGTHFTTTEDAYKARKWHVVDASGIPLGRLASEVAALIRGKHKVDFAPHTDVGDFVIVINASKVKLTGKKLKDKIYYSHSQYIGGLKQVTAGDLLENAPEKMIATAVEGMLPKGNLGHRMATKLKVFAGAEHTHAAQLPTEYKVKCVAA